MTSPRPRNSQPFRAMLATKPTSVLRNWMTRTWLPPRREWIAAELEKRGVHPYTSPTKKDQQ